MKTSLFDFTLPEGHIATAPAYPRDSSRMLVIGDGLQDKNISDLTAFLQAGDVLVFNDTKVIPARLLGARGNARIDVLLHKRIKNPSLRTEGEAIQNKAWIATSALPPRNDNNIIWQCFAKPAKKLRIGDTVIFAADFTAQVKKKIR